MRKYVLPMLAALAVATPAMANQARLEARGGVVWDSGTTEDVWGIAAGYDFDLGDTAFAGVEVSGDKIGVSGTKVSFGLTGRLGIKAGESTRLFGAGGYATETCDLCDGTWHLGAGLEQDVTSNVYVKAEYRHFFDNSVTTGGDALVAGVGLRF